MAPPITRPRPRAKNRRSAERLALRLNELAGEEVARAHHGSLAREQRIAIEPVRERVAERGASGDAHAGAPVETVRQFLDLPVIESDRDRRPLLDEDFREVATAHARGAEHLLDEFAFEHAGTLAGGRTGTPGSIGG